MLGTEEVEQISTQVGKTVDESKNENANTSTQNKVEQTNSTNENTKKTNDNANTKKDTTKKESTNTTSTKKENTNKVGETTTQTNTQAQKVEDPIFAYPVEGEVLKQFAKDNLVYSETLKEWVTHNGIDIKAEKASVVKASENGTVTAIKNDPRYGMTVIIEHVNGFVTRYSNLLTSEFVTVGEKVEKGQTIGTVGNSAAFEIADETHLHFEILKDNENLDPALYLK